MKCRIVQKGKNFYPQTKVFGLFWMNYFLTSCHSYDNAVYVLTYVINERRKKSKKEITIIHPEFSL
jgi:hypothetical protein